MTEFRREIRRQIAATRGELARARMARDEFLVQVHLGELETLARIAAEHGVPIDGDE